MNENIDGFELEYIEHAPQNGSGTIICKTAEVGTLFNIFNMWKKIFNLSFNFKPVLTNDELASSHTEDSFWDRD